MTSYTFVFMFFAVRDTPSGTSAEDENIDKLNAQLLSAKKFPNIKIVIVKSAFVNIGSTTTKTFNTSIKWYVPSVVEGENYSLGGSRELGNINIGQGDTLGMIFNFISFQFPADRIILYTNNHSNHFGSIADSLALVKHNNFFHTIRALDNTPEKPVFSFIAKPRQEIPHIDMLTHNELSLAIRNGLTGQANPRIDLLLLIGCYTGSLDNLILFKNHVKYLFSAEGLVFFDVIDLSRLIEYIVDNDSVEKGIELVFQNFHKDWEGKEFINENKLGIFNFTDLTEADDFVNKLNALLQFMISRPALLVFIRNQISMKLMFPFCDTANVVSKSAAASAARDLLTNCVDFIHFLKTINLNNPLSETDKAELGELSGNAEKALQKMIVHNHLDETVNEVDTKRRPFYGVACFLPILGAAKRLCDVNSKIRDQMSVSYSPFSVMQNEFAKQTLWPEFLQAIYKFT